MKKILIPALLVLAFVSAGAAVPRTDAERAEMDRFITSPIGRMTLDEKLGQLNLPVGDDIVTGGSVSNSGTLSAAAEGRLGGSFNIKGAAKIRALQEAAVEKSRLGIPLLIGMDVIHGYETVFPIPLALSCSWDMDAIEESARIAAVESSAAGVNWTFSPMVDISRDPRWGRMSEGSGEDPYLGSQIARAMVRGYQGDLTRDDQILACVKHFALYGASEAGRDYNTVDMSRLRMYNEYFEPYRAAVDEGAATVMTSFNLVDYVPATENKWLIDDVLRRQWGFDGMVVTDYGSIGEIATHGLESLPEASARALNAGTDMDMCSFGFIGTLKEALDKGTVSMETIDRAVRRILEAKFKLGLFENPYKYNDVGREKTDIYTPAHREAARRIATETFVLLKNEGSLLPLSKDQTVALVGPLASTAANMPGTWSVAADLKAPKTLAEGFADKLAGRGRVIYAKGANLEDDADLEAAATVFGRAMRDDRPADEMLAEALAAAAQADVIVAALGESSEYSGESSSRSVLTLPQSQRRLLEALLATGKPVVMLNFSGRPTVMAWENEHVPAIMNVWFGGSEAADAIADVVFGDVAPSGRLTASMPWNEGQIPVYYNHLNTGRPKGPDPAFQKYRSNWFEIPNEPLFPFGYGLGYTTFEYTPVVIDTPEISDGSTAKASVTVTNTGDREGTEVVQFYIRDVSASIARPVKELKYFERITLRPGESRTVTFPVTVDDLKFYNADLDYVAEPGLFEVMAGPDSRRTSSTNLTLK